MPETRLKCPSCKTVLKLAAPVDPGEVIKCPKCGAAMRVPAAAGKADGPAPGVARAASRPQPLRRAEPGEEPDEEAEDIEDEEEVPRRKKKAQRSAEEEDDFDEGPRKRRKVKKKQGNAVLLWSLIGGGVGLVVVVVVVLLATGVIGPKKGPKPADQIVGKWDEQQNRVPAQVIFEFKADGTVTVTTTGEKSSSVEHATYQFITDDEIELHGEIEGELTDSRGTVTIKRDEMTIKTDTGKIHRFYRVR